MLSSFFFGFNSFVVLGESAADHTIAGKQHCIVQNCKFATVLSSDDPTHDRRGFVIHYFERVRLYPSHTYLY